MLFDGPNVSKVLGTTSCLLSMMFIPGIIMHCAPPSL
jgi:hypothetical protein